MATDSEQKQASFKCRMCRQFLFNTTSVLFSSILGKDTAPVRGALWYISDDARPSWIQNAIEEAQWTRGKLACPKCKGRLGSFDFLTPSSRHCRGHQGPWSCTQIIDSRVDREIPQYVLAKLRHGNQVKGQVISASSDSSLTEDSLATGINALANNNNGALPKGCWYLNRDKMDTKQLLCETENSNANLMHGTQTRNKCEKDDQKSLNVLTDELKFEAPRDGTNHVSSDAHDCKLKPKTVSGHDNSVKSQPMTTETSTNSASAKPSMLVHRHLHLSGSTTYQHSCNESQLGEIKNARRQPVRTRYSQDDSKSEQSHGSQTAGAVKGSSSPEMWQGLLDEHLMEFDRERNGAPSIMQRGHNNILQLEDDMGIGRQDGNHGNQDGNHDEVSNSQDGNYVHRQGRMSAHLKGAIPRVQRRERNRRKGDRRKLRRQERWKEEKQMEKEELLVEQEKLDCDPEKILTLVGVCQSSVSVREALTCPVCLDVYLNPHICLPCQHIFCESCLRQLARTTHTLVKTPCPLCRTVILDVKLHKKLTSAIVEMFPRMTDQRKQAERKALDKYYPLPSQSAPSSLTSWIYHSLAGNRRNRRWRGRQERAMDGLITNIAWQLGAAVVLIIIVVICSVAFLFIMMSYS